MIKIEKNIPVPARGNSKYPFADMDVGDSFFIHAGTARDVNAAHNYGARKDKRFSCRILDGGVRIWRYYTCRTRRFEC